MPGLNLNAGLNVAAGLPPSYAGQTAGGGNTISDQAFGINGSGAPMNSGPKTAYVGVTSSGVIGAVLLVFIWWSLPR
jgi:hypothetical protein